MTQTELDFTSAVHKVEHHGTQAHLDENRQRFGKQCQMVYDYMMNHGSINIIQADAMGIKRLASRICDLKKALQPQGLTIQSEMVSCGETRVAEYSIKQITHV